MLFQMFLALNLLFLLFSTFVSLSNFDKSRSAIKLLVGKPSKSLSFSKLTSAARNIYSRPHFNLTADAADVHIIFKFLWIDCWSKQEITFHELKQHNFAQCLFSQFSEYNFGKISKRWICELTSMQFKNNANLKNCLSVFDHFAILTLKGLK